MKVFYDIRYCSPSREKWRPFTAKIVLKGRKRHILRVLEAKHSKDFEEKYLVCVKSQFVDKEVYMVATFWEAVKHLLFKSNKLVAEIPQELL